METENSNGTSLNIQKQVLNETLNGISSQNSSDTAALCCVICLSEITEPCTAKPCTHHNFDFLCLTTWLEQKPNCPLCKAVISEIQYNKNQTYRIPASTAHSVASRPARFRSGRFAGLPRRTVATATAAAAPPPPTPLQGALERRRHVYRNRLLSLHVGSNPASRYREITPASFDADPSLLSRARSWIRRELHVFEFLHSSVDDHNNPTGARRQQDNAEFVLEYVVAVLKTVDLQSSNGHAVELLRDFLGSDNARVFVHELRSFLRSPYSVEAWDRNVQYREMRGALLSPRRTAALRRAENTDNMHLRTGARRGRGRGLSRGRVGRCWEPDHQSLRGSRSSTRWSPSRRIRRGWRTESA